VSVDARTDRILITARPGITLSSYDLLRLSFSYRSVQSTVKETLPDLGNFKLRNLRNFDTVKKMK